MIFGGMSQATLLSIPAVCFAVVAGFTGQNMWKNLYFSLAQIAVTDGKSLTVMYVSDKWRIMNM
jgi:hypothetical protein